MNEWIILNNGREILYNDYQEALADFLTIIADHLWNHSYNNKSNGSPVYDRCGTPCRVGEFLGIRYDEYTISDEDIVVQSRLDMLLGNFRYKDANNIKTNALKIIKHSIKYHSRNEEFDQEISINIELKPKEIIAEVIGEDSLLKTNAFIFDDYLQKYYFVSEQKIMTSNDLQHLGKMVKLNITLQPYDDDIKEELFQKEKAESEARLIEQYRKYANIDKDADITEIDEWALNRTSCFENYDIHDLRELILANKTKK